MNLGDPEWELIDPTPDVHSLFLHFDKLFFWTKLASRAVVRWSKKMYSCAGICSYEGRAGFCDIALSEPLLKLRPRKDLIETLLHEMIHAYLFVTCRVQERDGHGPNFQSHMYRINKCAGLNISIYHEFHDEVELYQTHWWRCNGPCQGRKPHYGIVRRSQNRAPGPVDHWWFTHQKNCGGTFMKIKEPEKKAKKSAAKSKKNNGDITKYINNNNKENAKDVFKKPPIVKNVSNTPTVKTKSNGGNTLVVTQKGVNASPIKNKILPVVPAFTGKGQPVSGNRPRRNSVDVTEAVRNVWANKKIPGLVSNSQPNKKLVTPKKETLLSYNKTDSILNTNKHKIKAVNSDSPPAKVKKIDDYFKSKATNILKDVYGEELFKEKTIDDLIPQVSKDLVNCPVCSLSIDSTMINRHLDVCLNKEIINDLSKGNDFPQDIDPKPIVPSQHVASKDNNLPQEIHSKPINTSQHIDKELIQSIARLDALASSHNNEMKDKLCKEENGKVNTLPSKFICDYDVSGLIMKEAKPFPHTNAYHNHINELVNQQALDMNIRVERKRKFETDSFDSNDVNKVKAIVKKINYDKHIRKSDNFVVPKKEPDDIDCGFLPSFLDDMGTAIKAPTVKIEPGTSKDIVATLTETRCPCCSNNINKPLVEHLDECLAFFTNNSTIPEEGASTSFANNTIVIDDDDDIFDETMTMNATGTKTPCPCCMEMVESAEMNEHLDICLS